MAKVNSKTMFRSIFLGNTLLHLFLFPLLIGLLNQYILYLYCLKGLFLVQDLECMVSTHTHTHRYIYIYMGSLQVDFRVEQCSIR